MTPTPIPSAAEIEAIILATEPDVPACVDGSAIWTKRLAVSLHNALSRRSLETAGGAEWESAETAPRTGEEFIARNESFLPFSCQFWQGEFVHFEPADGPIRYAFTHWLPMEATCNDSLHVEAVFAPSTLASRTPNTEMVVKEDDWSFQQRVGGWMRECFTPEIIADKLERNDRFIEEALELVQSLNYSADRAHALVDYVFGREKGEPSQEVGGVMVTLAALCNPNDLNMDMAAETELARILDPAIVLKIRAKQAAKPTGSALPAPLASPPSPAQVTDEQWPSLEEAYGAAVASAQMFSDAASVEETNWTGWGEQTVPHDATMRRVKADQALAALRDADPRMFAALQDQPGKGG